MSLSTEPDSQRQRTALHTDTMLREALNHHLAGRLEQAEPIYLQILDTGEDPQILHLLGMICHHTGRHALAVEHMGRAIALRPELSAFHSDLGAALQAQGHFEDAALAYQEALQLEAHCVEAHINLAVLLLAQGERTRALHHGRRANALRPDNAEILVNLGCILEETARLEDESPQLFDEAIACLERAVALDPTSAIAQYNLGYALHSKSRLHQARAALERAISLQADYAEAHHNLGHVLRSLGLVEEALASYGTALILRPTFPQAIFSQATAWLLHADYTRGWPGYESRWSDTNRTSPKPVYTQTEWTGEPASRVHIWGEQGVGDEIQFAGLLPDLLRTGTPCVLQCDRRLQPLFARSFPTIQVISDSPPPPCSAHLPSGSLPAIFRRSTADFQHSAPYLVAEPTQRDTFRARYSDGRLLVGLAWHTTNRISGRKRSIELTALHPLFLQPDIRWISLQYGDHNALESQAASPYAPILIDRSVDQFDNIDRFAAQIDALDLVITIDNSTAHLAGALGVPTWVLLPFASDWRWLQHRNDSPWYPAMRLFRQPAPGDWPAIVERVTTELASLPIRGPKPLP